MAARPDRPHRKKPHPARKRGKPVAAQKAKTRRPRSAPRPSSGPAAEDTGPAFSWYPGHMVKAKRALQENLKLTDAVLLLVDARAPRSSRHPELESILSERGTPFVLVLNKADLAEPEATAEWLRALKAEDRTSVDMSALHGRGTGPLTSLLEQLERTIGEARARKGLLPRAPRLMVAGLPNSGKSTLLNRLVGKTRFRAGKKPGLTRGSQWVRVAGRYDLLDTPGILYPRIEGDAALAYLSALGSVKRDVLPRERVVRTLVNELTSRERLFELFPALEAQPKVLLEERPLEALSASWGFLQSGDEEPINQAFERFLNRFAERGTRVTWERPQETG